MSDALFTEVLASARATLPDAAHGERAAWVSSALALWREPGIADDPTRDDIAFVEWLLDRRDPVVDLVLAVIGSLELGAATQLAAAAVVPVPPPGSRRAWCLGDGGAEVVAIEWAHADDDCEVLLVDIDDQETLSGIEFVTEADDLVDFAAGEGSVSRIETTDAAARVAAALTLRAASPGAPGDAELANVVLLRARLAQLGAATPDPRWLAEVPTPQVDPEADAAAVLTLRSALPQVIGAEAPVGAEAMVEPVAELVRWSVGIGRPVQELEALASLEWADWLGAVIGSVRAGVGEVLSGEILVDRVNRCPEVTSTIPKQDRAWFAWAFAVAMETWREVGVLDDGLRLTEAGTWVLPQALLRAWAPASQA
jgi:hypothetical protein